MRTGFRLAIHGGSPHGEPNFKSSSPTATSTWARRYRDHQLRRLGLRHHRAARYYTLRDMDSHDFKLGVRWTLRGSPAAADVHAALMRKG